jgi:squalene-hopene/tetraprenyl-beta-curcumene cyclase
MIKPPEEAMPDGSQLDSPSAQPEMQALNAVIEDARSGLMHAQQADGHWLFELEADVTIPAEFIMLEHFLDDIDEGLERRIGVYLRSKQNADGGWPLFHRGETNISATVKAYYALKLLGDDPDASHMRRAREAIITRGGAVKTNVFTRFALAIFGQVPWRAVPVMPLEIMLLPRWFPFHLSKVSYWSRTVIIPLLIIAGLRARARNPRHVSIRELFITAPEKERRYVTNVTGDVTGWLFLQLDRILRCLEPFSPGPLRRRAIARARAFVTERLNGEDGLGGIFPAMANSVMAFDVLGYSRDHPDFKIALAAVRNLLVVEDERAYCQPCLSPVWDTCLAAHAMMEADEESGGGSVSAALDWLLEREVKIAGDWQVRRPNLAPGGWAFQYRNDHYPDVDDTAVVVMAMHRSGDKKYVSAIERATAWIVGMQSSEGGWGAFEPENTHYYLNAIPFADHGALLDPPTADVTARCLSMLAQLGYNKDYEPVARAINYLKREQEKDGSWFGRWGINYIYGTWSVLCALNALEEDMSQPYIRAAVKWLEDFQGGDGGWGEDGATYWQNRRGLSKESTASQTAWACLALMAAGETDSAALRNGIRWLMTRHKGAGDWSEDWYTGGGFPRVFYLRYHGYRQYFPLWALARYRNLQHNNTLRPAWGM